MAIEVTARGREREVCPFCRDGLAGAVDALFECPACGTRTHAECRREAGKCTTAGCTGPPPGAAAEAARRRRAETPPPATEKDPRPTAQGPIGVDAIVLPFALSLVSFAGGALGCGSGLYVLSAVSAVWLAVAIVVAFVVASRRAR